MFTLHLSFIVAILLIVCFIYRFNLILTILIVIILFHTFAQEVPQELHDMAARFEAWKERNRDEDGRSRRGGFGGGGFGGGGGGFGGGGGGFGGGGGGFGGRRGGRRGAINISSDFP